MMAEEGDELGLTVVPTKRRRRYDPAWKARLVAACLEPGASVSRLALEHRVNANLVWKWIQRHDLAKQETTFIVRAYLLQTHEMLFDAHNHAFRVFGGIPPARHRA